VQVVERRIVSFHADEHGDWVATLDCHHRQHVRHQPPFRTAPWVLEEAGRAGRIGGLLDCPLCDRAELPADLEVVRTTESWTAATVPAALKRDHRVARGVWGRLHVEQGSVTFRADTQPRIERRLAEGDEQAIPPEVPHAVEPDDTSGDGARFHVEFLRPPATLDEVTT
jgi:tellurite resistance-related uncharacterized protein